MPAETATAPAPAGARPTADPLGLRPRRRRAALTTGALLVALVASAVVATGAGAFAVPPELTARIVAYRLFAVGDVTWSPAQEAVVWDVRVPRVLLAVAVGAGLAVCGAALQAMVRNVLADPYLLGINSGASTGAAAAILLGVGAGWGAYALSLSAFLGALAAAVLVFVVARTGGRVTSMRLLLAGVAVGYALYAATSFLIFASGSAEGARSVLFWLLGSLGLARWDGALAVVVVVVLVTVAALAAVGRRLDALSIGDETAHTLGVSPAACRTRLLVLVALCTGVLVAASGSIGFVGLVVPHLARRLVGAAHRLFLPVAALLGSLFLVGADVVARTLVQPQELPLGIVTSLVGAPFLLLLVRRTTDR